MAILGRFNSDGTVAEYPTVYANGGAFNPASFGQAVRVGVGDYDFYVLEPNTRSLPQEEVDRIVAAERGEPAAVEAAEEGAPEFALRITAEPETGPAPLQVQFNFAYDLPGLLKSTSWDFGDGHGSRKLEPEHVFDEAGKYNVVLTAKHEDGAAGKGILELVVAE